MCSFPPHNLTDSKEIFNYSLSRARRCVEYAFSILRASLRFLAKELETNVENLEKIVKAACLLHNSIIKEEGLSLDDFIGYGG